MISNRILQTTVEGLKAISRVDLCIVDADKNVAAKTFDNVSECLADAISFIDSPAESQAVNGFQFFKVEDEGNLEYIIMARGGMALASYAVFGAFDRILIPTLRDTVSQKKQKVFEQMLRQEYEKTENLQYVQLEGQDVDQIADMYVR